MGKRVIVIGGGASGMVSAIFAARQGAAVTLLEHTDRVGKKILSTGNGKCNLSNKKMDVDCYRSDQKDFPMEVLSRFGVEETIEFFEDLGIVIKERDGYLYPNSGQAASVSDVLRMELVKQRVNIITECVVDKMDDHDGELREYRITTSKGIFHADAVILATGSQAAPTTGSDGSGYALAKSLGLLVVKPLPALVPLLCKETFYKQVAGVRVYASVKLMADGTLQAKDLGEVQLTEYGISGIPVFQVSRFASKALDKKQKVEAVIDFYPEQSRKYTEKFMAKRCICSGEKHMDVFFTGWFNKKLALLFLKLAGIDGKRTAKSISSDEQAHLVSLIKEFKTQITSTNSFSGAQICCGGVDVREIDPETMETKKKKGLYLIGELLDVDGICGGYNLQWAWSTGAIAGTHAGL
ncbi:MAG: NAD(P)/FAD-dependent oxidoreductase [Clostridium sp.]